MSLISVDPRAPRTPDDPQTPLGRMTRLLDDGSMVVMDSGSDSSVRTARGRIDGVEVVVYGTDPRRKGGSLAAPDADRIVHAIVYARRRDCPVIGLWHSGGAALTDGVESMEGVGRMFSAMTEASGRIPQISVVLGPAAGAAAYGPGLTDIVIMSTAGKMFITGPQVVRSVTGEEIDLDGLGGPEAHGSRSGVVHLAAPDEEDALDAARRLTGYLSHRGHFTPDEGQGRDLRSLLPESARRAYDVRPLVHALFDVEAGRLRFDELQPRWAPNLVIGIGRLGGGSVGVLANNPLRKGGCLDSLASEKAARFVRMCDAFGIPLLVIVDVPGYLPGVDQEWGGVIRRGAKLLHAFAGAVVPRVTLVTRKSYGGAYIAMNSRSLGAATVFAWPSAEIAVMGAEAAVGVLHRDRLAGATAQELPQLRARLEQEFRTVSGGVDRAADLGAVDEVIDPASTRRRLVEAFAAAAPARGRHDNIPL
ncbi:acyl-CoA carboxylase subunit beta [Micromonospora zamorensis]|uniref:acyl-CoA carboxylase subunit beta n=1 Tax=Micromonospora zamorensis TaxID=709883 RepID=UPI003D944E40